LSYIHQCAGYVRTHEQQMALLEEYHAHANQDAMDAFILSQLYWIAQSFHKHYRESGFLMDLIQDANVRLLSLVYSYDTAKGVKFRTYAEPILVKEAAVNLLRYTHGRADKVSVYKRSFHYRRVYNGYVDNGLSRQDALWATARVFQMEQRKRDFDELSPMSKQATYDLVLSLIALTTVDVSLDAPMGEEGDYTMGEQVSDVRPGPEDTLIEQEDVRLLKAALMTLDERHRFVVVRSEGLFGYSQLRTVEIAEILGVSRQRVNVMLNVSLGKIKQYIVDRR